jgi:hypothetical protein
MVGAAESADTTAGTVSGVLHTGSNVGNDDDDLDDESSAPSSVSSATTTGLGGVVMAHFVGTERINLTRFLCRSQ